MKVYCSLNYLTRRLNILSMVYTCKNHWQNFVSVWSYSSFNISILKNFYYYDLYKNVLVQIQIT